MASRCITRHPRLLEGRVSKFWALYRQTSRWASLEWFDSQRPLPRILLGTRHAHTIHSSRRLFRATLKPQDSEKLRAVDRISQVLRDALHVLNSPIPPKEEAVLNSLRTCEDLASYFKGEVDTSKDADNSNVTPAMTLLLLDEELGSSDSSSETASALAAAIRDKATEKISETAHDIIVDPNVFITPKILQSYVNIQSLLEQSDTLSQAFELFANKPVPLANTFPVKYAQAKPNKLSSAVPLETANDALTVAIQAKQLPHCMDIINATVCTPAFIRSKIMKRALTPIAGFALAPAAVYIMASNLAAFQNSMSPEMATKVAFAGILSYVGFTATIGFVAVTTANDQMDRVTWATGMPLRERWLREEERAMLDRVAGAWGFKESSKRGDEQGVEWEALREFIGLRGMILDRVGLMEGME